MVPFSDELLTILVLVCISWAGVTCIAVIILSIIVICKACSKRRRNTSIHTTRSQTSSPSILLPSRSPSIVHIPKQKPVTTINEHKRQEVQTHSHHTMSVIDEHPHSAYDSRNKYPQETYRPDETVRLDEHRVPDQRRQQRPYRPLKPMTDIRVNARRTPYPPDVIVRANLMDNNRLSMDDKY